MEQPTQQQTIIIMGKPKSVAVALILTFLFGPLGLLYSTVAGGVIMMILGAIVCFFTLGIGLIVVWPICLIWAVIATNMANKKSSVTTKHEK